MKFVVAAVVVLLMATGCAHKKAEKPTARIFLNKECVLGYWVQKNGCEYKGGLLVCDGVVIKDKDIACLKVVTDKK